MINVALFGFGRIGQMHGSNLFKHPKFNLKYVYDRDEKLAKKSERMFKAKSIKNYKTALLDKSIGVIFIASSILNAAFNNSVSPVSKISLILIGVCPYLREKPLI